MDASSIHNVLIGYVCTKFALSTEYIGILLFLIFDFKTTTALDVIAMTTSPIYTFFAMCVLFP